MKIWAGMAAWNRDCWWANREKCPLSLAKSWSQWKDLKQVGVKPATQLPSCPFAQTGRWAPPHSLRTHVGQIQFILDIQVPAPMADLGRAAQRPQGHHRLLGLVMHLERLLLDRRAAQGRRHRVERPEGDRGGRAGDGVVPRVRGWDGRVAEDVGRGGAGRWSSAWAKIDPPAHRVEVGWCALEPRSFNHLALHLVVLSANDPNRAAPRRAAPHSPNLDPLHVDGVPAVDICRVRLPEEVLRVPLLYRCWQWLCGVDGSVREGECDRVVLLHLS